MPRISFVLKITLKELCWNPMWAVPSNFFLGDPKSTSLCAYTGAESGGFYWGDDLFFPQLRG